MTLAAIKRQTFDQLQAVARGADEATAWHEDACLWGSHPFNENTGIDAIRSINAKIRTSFPDMERRDLIFLAGQSHEDRRVDPSFTGRTMIAAMGHIQATFEQDFLGIPATHGVIMLRYCEAHHVTNGKIAQSYVFFDLLDLMAQAGVWPIMPSLGAMHIWPGPYSNDGVRPDTVDEIAGDASFARVIEMHNALLSFDGKNLDSMDHASFWTKDFMYYANAGIGAARGLKGFRAHHQIPFLTGFPDRSGAGHFIRIGDGNFAVTGGWPSVRATHTGTWLGMPPTGRRIDMRVMDFYHFKDGKICENWLPFDIPHVLMQMGFDVFARLEHTLGNPKMTL